MAMSVTAALVQVGIAHSRNFSFLAYYPFVLSIVVFAVMACAASPARRRVQGLLWCLFIACLGVAAEWLTVFLPMPINVALSQYKQIDMVQISSVHRYLGRFEVPDLVHQRRARGFLLLTRREEANPFARRRLMFLLHLAA